MKVGLIGCGYWGKILESKLSKYFDIVFIADSKTDYNLDLVEWVFIATPLSTHYDIVKKCLESSKNVFCEKPFTLDIDKSNELFKLADKNGVSLYIDNIFLDRKEIIEIKTELELLDITTIEFTWSSDGLSNGSLVDGFLYHDIYLMMYLLGEYDDGIEVNFINNIEDILNLFFNYGNVDIFINYDSKNPIKSKVIKINNDMTIDLTNGNNDPLDEIIKKISDGVDLNLVYNKMITLKTEEKIKKLIG